MGVVIPFMAMLSGPSVYSFYMARWPTQKLKKFMPLPLPFKVVKILTLDPNPDSVPE